MKIEAGKYYVTRGGDVVGPMVYVSDGSSFPWRKDREDSQWKGYTDNGRYTGSYYDYHLDLIKEHVMPKFKIGDRVKWRGLIGKVTRVTSAVEFTSGEGWKVTSPIDDTEPADQPSLDLTKPVQTRDGRKVRVLCTDGPGEWPVIGIIEDGHDDVHRWQLNGRGGLWGDLSIDLINTPATPRTFERWFNVYKENGSIVMHGSRFDANDEIPWDTRIARKRVVFTEGEWDE